MILLSKAQTAYFVSIVMAQISNLIMRKTHKSSIFCTPLRNKHTAIAILVEIILVILFIFTPGINSVVGMTQFPSSSLWIPIATMLTIVLYEEARKLILRKNPQSKLHSALFF